MTDRVLGMLYQYLLSNQALQLNETFQIYCKILSIEHSSFKQQKKPSLRKRKKTVGHVHVGNSKRLYRYPWAIDVPSKGQFKGLCLLICTIFGLLQHLYFESEKKNKLYEYISRINGLVQEKKTVAERILLEQLAQLFSVTKLKQVGPYKLKTTIILLSQTYQCQFFIFDSFNRTSKIYYMYPEKFDDSLKPIFLFRPKYDTHHLIFIRNLNSFFTSNYSVCLACFKHFKRNRDSRSSHLCQQKPSCFACRRFFQTSNTYINSNVKKRYCDKLTTQESTFSCPKCNCDLYSSHCFSGHKYFCKGKGYFGYKCKLCNRFTYCNGKLTSDDLKKNHDCLKLKDCKFCFGKRDADHLCLLKQEKVSSFQTRLSFFNLILDDKNHKPLGALFLREENKRGSFTYYSFFNSKTSLEDIITPNYFNVNYFGNALSIANSAFNTKARFPKTMPNFKSYLQKSGDLEDLSFIAKLLGFLLDTKFAHTSYICDDSSSQNMVIIQMPSNRQNNDCCIFFFQKL